MTDFLHTLGEKMAAALSAILLFFSGGAPAAEMPLPSPQAASAVVASTDPSLVSVDDADAPPAASPTSGNTETRTVVNQYITQPVVERVIQTIVPQSSDSSVPRDLFDSQTDATFDSIDSAVDGLQESIDTSVDTDALTVSGASTLGALSAGASTLSSLSVTGNAEIDGTLTAGTLSVAAVSSGGAVEAPYFTATSTSASSTFPNLNATNATTTNSTSTNLYSSSLTAGNATSTNLFSTLGRFTNAIVDTLLTAVSATITNLTATELVATNATTTNATTTNLAVTSTASTSALVASNSFTFSTVTGFLKATAGAVATALIDLANDVTGILPVGSGGTGWGNLQANTLLLGNGTSQIATTSAGTNGQVLALSSGVPTWTATTTFSSGLSYSGGNVINTGVLSVAQTYGSAQTGALTLATSSALSFNGLTISNSITNSGATFTFAPNSISGTLDNAGLTNPSVTVNGTAISLGGSGTITAASSTLLANTNTWTGTQNFANITLSQGTSTNFAVTSITSAIPLAAADGSLSEYAGSSCTNQFVRSLNGAGVATCATVTNDDLAGSISPTKLSLTKGYFIVGDDAGTAQATSTIYISSTGNVGIGTTTPQNSLTVVKSGNATLGPVLQLDNSGGSVGDAMALRFSSIAVPRAEIRSTVENNPFYGNLEFHTGVTTLTEKMRITGAGNVGIGDTSPNATLHVSRTSLTAPSLTFDADATAIFRSENQQIAFGSQSTSPWPVYIQGRDIANAAVNLALNPLGGNVGIGTTNPNQGKLEVKGGSVCVDTDSDDGATSCIANESDERLKENIETLNASTSLDTLLKLNPVSFDWRVNDPTVLAHYPLISRFASSTYSVGLIAQDVQLVFPVAIDQETVGDSEVRYFQLDYKKFIPLIISAVKEIASVGGAFKANLIEWFADAANGITDFFAEVGNFQRVNTDELCVGSTCVSESQLQTLLTNSGQSASASAAASPSNSGAPADTEPPDATDTAEGTSTPAEAANDNDPAASSTPSSADFTPPEAANDNVPMPIEATGTDSADPAPSQ
jgi:hypothetical protein